MNQRESNDHRCMCRPNCVHVAIMNVIGAGMGIPFSLLLCLGMAGFARAEPPDSKTSAEKDAVAKAAWRELLNRQPAEYTIYAGGEAKKSLSLRTQPVLRWANLTRITSKEAGTFIWTAGTALAPADAGRPEAVACAFTVDPQGSEFAIDLQSLSRGPLVAVRNGSRVWFPSQPGVKFRPVPDAPAPADSSVARLRQMKTLARRFSVKMLGWMEVGGSDQEELRMFPQPIYRYHGPDPELLDGALFVFVQGTDPETLLMLEAVRTQTGLQWQYDLVRRTSAALEGRYQGKTVWEAPMAHYPTNPQATRIEFRHKLQQ